MNIILLISTAPSNYPWTVSINFGGQLNEYCTFLAPQSQRPGGWGGAYRMVASVVRLSSINIFKGFSSETTGPISIKCQMQHPGRGGKKGYTFGPGHMTKMATLPVYGKNLKIFSRTT